MRVQSPGWEDPLEEDTATHSSLLPGKISRTEEPHGLQSTGSQRVSHDYTIIGHFHIILPSHHT